MNENKREGQLTKKPKSLSNFFGSSANLSNIEDGPEPEPTGLKRIYSNLGSIRGQFDDWNRFEIVEVLIKAGHTLRDEVYLSNNTLRNHAEHVFKNKQLPKRPMPYTLEEKKRRNDAATVIQNFWFNSLIKINEKCRLGAIVQQNLDRLKKLPLHKALSHENSQSMALVRKYTNEASAFEDDDENYDYFEDEEKGFKSILEEPWIEPNWEFAKIYANFHHPREGGNGGTLMPLWDTKLGRHCTSGGCGEQWDLFEEKQVSELGRYGPGITNYFKFLKWLSWVFLILSVFFLPVLVLNTFGNGDQQSASLTDLSRTMAGNLGDTNNSYVVTFPGCDDQIYGQQCAMNKTDVAVLYSWIDVLSTFTVLVAFIWLRVFQVKEEIVLDKNSVTAANYTVTVRGLPNKLFVERELMKHFAEVTSHPVSAVSLAFDSEQEILLYRRRGELLKLRNRYTQEYRYYRTLQKQGKTSVTDEFLLGILDKRVQTTAAIRDIDSQTQKLGERREKPIYAFVTFEKALGARLAVKAYNKSLLGYIRMPESLRFKGNALTVKNAPEPSTIIWENLKYRAIFRFQRRLITNIITILLLVISAIANIGAKSVEQRATNKGGTAFCPEDFTSWSNEAQEEAVTADPELLHCYCDQYSLIEQSENNLCKSYFTHNLRANILVYFAAFVVLVINSSIDFFLHRSANFERHHSVDAMERSIFLRMFLLKFINSGVLFLFLSSITYFNNIFGGSTNYDKSFSTYWYQTTGVSIVLVQCGNIITPHVWKLYRYWAQQKKLQKAKKDPLEGALTQAELNSLHLGPEFLVSHRYAQVMADFAVCYIFLTGMPILAVIAVIDFAVTYWIDKYLFLRFYRSPPRFRNKIGKMATTLIPYIVIAHLLVSIWSLGNDRLFQSERNINHQVNNYGNQYNTYQLGSKVTERHIFPLFVLLILVVIGVLFGSVLEDISSGILAVMKKLFGNVLTESDFYHDIEKFATSGIDVPYSKAVRRGIIRGLATYNILQNPKYKEAFAISDSFALAHSRVRSLRTFGKISFEEDNVNAAKEMEETDEIEESKHFATPEVLKLVQLSNLANRVSMASEGSQHGGESVRGSRHGRSSHGRSSEKDPNEEDISDNRSSSRVTKKPKKRIDDEYADIAIDDESVGGLSTTSKHRRSKSKDVDERFKTNRPLNDRSDEYKASVRVVTGVLVSDGDVPPPQYTAPAAGKCRNANRRDSGDLDDSDDDSVSQSRSKNRPISAQVDMKNAYSKDDLSIRRKPLGDNPMNGDGRRQKASTLDNISSQAVRKQYGEEKASKRRPSVEDQTRINAFKEGRMVSSRRVSNRTQL